MRPVIPVIVNCLAGLPAPVHRCHALRVSLRRTVDRWPERVAFLGGRIETVLRYPRERLEAEAGPGGHEIRTWITVAASAGDGRGSRLAYPPAPAWSTGRAVAALEPR
jgi:hypothetical protein